MIHAPNPHPLAIALAALSLLAAVGQAQPAAARPKPADPPLRAESACPAKNPVPADGCLYAANLAAMAADPKEAAAGKALGPSDGAREATIVERYRRSEPPPAPPAGPTVVLGGAAPTGGQ